MLTRSHSNSVENSKTTEQETRMSADDKNLTIADLMKEIHEGNKKTSSKLTDMDKTLKDNKKLFEDYMAKNDETVNKLRDELNDAKTDLSTLQNTVTGLERAVNELTEEIKTVQQDMKLHKTNMQKLQKNGKVREDEKRKTNIIIEGLKEDAKLHPRQQVGSLLKDIGVTIPQENIRTVTDWDQSAERARSHGRYSLSSPPTTTNMKCSRKLRNSKIRINGEEPSYKTTYHRRK